MKGRRFFTVLTVVLAVTLFTTFAFGQVNPKAGKNSTNKAIDSVAQVVESLQSEVLAESGLDGNSPPVCEEKLGMYQNALNSLGSAATYVGMAYDAYAAFLKTKNTAYLISVYQYVSLAWAEVSNASTWIAQARDYSCPA
ncbi:MAG: hypothetical protein GYA35_05405 [Thermoanaerobaculaceae bacterium]|nr:hypothetical protein [Thermoanaerobaculaceae bacterium]